MYEKSPVESFRNYEPSESPWDMKMNEEYKAYQHIKKMPDPEARKICYEADIQTVKKTMMKMAIKQLEEIAQFMLTPERDLEPLLIKADQIGIEIEDIVDRLKYILRTDRK